MHNKTNKSYDETQLWIKYIPLPLAIPKIHTNFNIAITIKVWKLRRQLNLKFQNSINRIYKEKIMWNNKLTR